MGCVEDVVSTSLMDGGLLVGFSSINILALALDVSSPNPKGATSVRKRSAAERVRMAISERPVTGMGTGNAKDIPSWSTSSEVLTDFRNNREAIDGLETVVFGAEIETGRVVLL